MPSCIKYYSHVVMLAVLMTSFILSSIRIFIHGISEQACINLAKLPVDRDLASGPQYRTPHPITQAAGTYIFGCHNIGDIDLRNHSIGLGINKKTYVGRYNGLKVALKMATYDNNNSKRCIPDGLPPDPGRLCYRFGNMKLMKDILLSQTLSHPNLLRLLGYCIRSEETVSKSQTNHGLIAVYEHGVPLTSESSASWTSHKRLDVAIEMVDLMVYMENSPIGHIRIADLKPAHFLIVNGRVTLFDLDDVTAREISCPSIGCPYKLPCVKGFCDGFTRVTNMERLFIVFYHTFLRKNIYSKIPGLPLVMNKMHNKELTMNQLKQMLVDVKRSLPNNIS